MRPGGLVFSVLGTQEAGDVLMVPAGWAHATLNLLPSVGVAREMESMHLHEE